MKSRRARAAAFSFAMGLLASACSEPGVEGSSLEGGGGRAPGGHETAPDGSGETYGGGTFIPWNSQSVLVGSGTLAAAVTGLSTVEVIAVAESSVEVREVIADQEGLTASNCGPREPMALALADMDGSGDADLVVQDPCGSWVAERDSGGMYRPSRSALVDAVGASLYMAPLRRGAVLVLGNFDVLSVLEPGKHRIASIGLPGVPLSLRVTRLFVPIADFENGDSTTLLVQRKDGLVIIPVLNDALLQGEPGPVLEQHYERPYVRPFEAYDQLTDMSISGCPEMALGVGIFNVESGDVPRRLQAILLDDAARSSGKYTATDFPNVQNVLAIAMSDAPAESRFLQLLAVIHTEKDAHLFSLLGRTGCAEWSTLSTRDIDFDIRSPPSPAWGEVANVPVTEYVVLVGALREDLRTVEFYHYDGYDLRVMSANAQTWEITQRIERLHDERDDLSYR